MDNVFGAQGRETRKGWLLAFFDALGEDDQKAVAVAMRQALSQADRQESLRARQNPPG